MDANRKRLYRWIEAYPDRRASLLPQNLPDELLELLVDDSKRTGEHISCATLLMKSHVEDCQSLVCREEELTRSIHNYVHALRLEQLQRRNILRYEPSATLDNVLAEEPFHYELTDYGRSIDSKELSLPRQ